MSKNRKLFIFFGCVFILIPFIHIFLYSLISTSFFRLVCDFILNFINLIKSSINYHSIFFYLWVIELVFFLTIGIKLIVSKKYSLHVIALFSEIFIVINLISLIIYKGSNLYWYILPLIFSIYSLGIVGYMRLTSIRKLPFLFYNIKFFRPYFRHRCYADALLNNRMRKFESKLISISNKGAHFLANKVVQVGDEYNLIFKFNGKELRLKIKVIRVIVGELSYINGFGAKIIKIDNKTKQALLAYLRESESIQIYRPRFKGVNISIDIISDEGVIKNKIYDIDKKGAFIISNDRWRLNDKIIGNIKIKDDQYKIEGEIIRLNDKQEISYPKGFAIIFEKYPDDFHKRLKKVVKK